MKVMNNNNNDNNNPLKTPYQVQLDKLQRLEIEYHKAHAEVHRIKREIEKVANELSDSLTKQGL